MSSCTYAGTIEKYSNKISTKIAILSQVELLVK